MLQISFQEEPFETSQAHPGSSILRPSVLEFEVICQFPCQPYLQEYLTNGKSFVLYVTAARNPGDHLAILPATKSFSHPFLLKSSKNGKTANGKVYGVMANSTVPYVRNFLRLIW